MERDRERFVTTYPLNPARGIVKTGRTHNFLLVYENFSGANMATRPTA